ncbi:GtrA family protein [Vibrio superstes]|uniref:GtrA/DPMS transmembrane domain-containing protein n=1 Tax=Vibrio superstes NBRC 103154 TaxID=1219062 RepID=A0A511QPA4_9VIBR|nr:GtrA family protein [Vibrio superstes]GEM79144.1 hypothetical protein VSU01S_13890 [Vibrio superstes NBRC 103154]
MVGSLGFLIDSISFFLLFSLFEIDTIYARLVAFCVAASANWLGNRLFTFCKHNPNKLTQWLRFMFSAGISAIPNLAVFVWLSTLLPSSDLGLFIALACGALIGMGSNFLLSQHWVYRNSLEQ